MYEELLQSDSRPFRATPDRQFYFPSEAIETARQTSLRATLRAEGPVLIMGGAGLGKSLLAQILADDLSARFDIVNLHAAQLCSRKALLQSILFELQMPYRDLSEGELRLSILDRLVPSPETAPDGVLMIVDEAHTLPIKLLDELRLITNFTRGGQPRARVVLLGSLKLEDIFAQPKLDSFNQRLAARCYLQPLSRSETRDFVRHQLSVAGLNPDEAITGDALDTVFTASDGLPRITNQLMDHAVVLAGTKTSGAITAQLIEEAWADLQQLPAPWHAGEEALNWNASDSQQSSDQASTAANSASFAEFGEATPVEDENTSVFEFGPAPTTTTPSAEPAVAEIPSDDPSQLPDSEQVADDQSFEDAAESVAPAGINKLNNDEVSNASEPIVVETSSNAAPNPVPNVTVPSAPEQNVTEPVVAEPTAAEPESVAGEAESTNFFAAFTPDTGNDLPDPDAPTVLSAENLASEDIASDSQDFFAGRPTDDKMLAFAEEAAELESVSPQLQANGVDAINVSDAVEAMNIDAAQVYSYFDGDLSEEESAAALAIDTAAADTEASKNFVSDTAETQSFETVEPAALPAADPSEFSQQEINAVPCPATSGDCSSEQLVTSSSTDLFGDDFEEEFAIDSQGFSQSPLPGDTFGADSQSESPIIERLSDQSATAEQPQTTESTPAVELSGINENVLASENATEQPFADSNIVNTEPACESNSTGSDNPWSVDMVSADMTSTDIVSTDVQSEQSLHNEIEDIVSQLNFSAFTVENETLEQVAEESKANSEASISSTNQDIPEDSVRRGENDDVYMLHRPIDSDAEGNIFTQVAEYDDDRDLLVIEEDIPVTDGTPTKNDDEPAKQTVAYSQLFAKLRK